MNRCTTCHPAREEGITFFDLLLALGLGLVVAHALSEARTFDRETKRITTPTPPSPEER